MALLGDDGRGYELARKLEGCGVWRSWLGDSLYSGFVHHLSSSSSWEAFMRTDNSKPRAQIQLQLRARALLFDKASVSLFLQPLSSAQSSSAAVSKLNPDYLQLNGHDVYFTLESSGDGIQQDDGLATSKIQSKVAFSMGSRYRDNVDIMPQRFRHEEFPETWYSQFMDKYRTKRSYKLALGDKDPEKRTPEEMSSYLLLVEKHKKRRMAFNEDPNMSYGTKTTNKHSDSVLDGSRVPENDAPFFPETMFVLNSVPDSALSPSIGAEDDCEVKFRGILDKLLQSPPRRSSVMIERLGSRSEYLSTDQGEDQCRGIKGSAGNKPHLSQEQALKVSQKVIARMLVTAGFERGTDVPMEVLSQLLSCHISKLGRILKILADSYRKQCSAVELLKMFLQTAGHDNFGELVELLKDGTKSSMQHSPQPVQGTQSHLQSPLLHPQQIPGQLHPQMQQMVQSQLTSHQQQQWESLLRRQLSTPHPGTETDKDQPTVQVKIETPPEFSTDFHTPNPRHTQMQLRQQQMAVMSNLLAQSGKQFRQQPSLQISPNVGGARPPPVKVEGFQELMGGDSTLKYDSEENKLTSPSK